MMMIPFQVFSILVNVNVNVNVVIFFIGLSVYIRTRITLLAEISTTRTSISYSKLYFGGIEGGEIIPSTAPGLKGSMTQVHFNGQEFFELSRAGQLDVKLKENNNAKLSKL